MKNKTLTTIMIAGACMAGAVQAEAHDRTAARIGATGELLHGVADVVGALTGQPQVIAPATVPAPVVAAPVVPTPAVVPVPVATPVVVPPVVPMPKIVPVRPIRRRCMPHPRPHHARPRCR